MNYSSVCRRDWRRRNGRWLASVRGARFAFHGSSKAARWQNTAIFQVDRSIPGKPIPTVAIRYLSLVPTARILNPCAEPQQPGRPPPLSDGRPESPAPPSGAFSFSGRQNGWGWRLDLRSGFSFSIAPIPDGLFKRRGWSYVPRSQPAVAARAITSTGETLPNTSKPYAAKASPRSLFE